MNRFLTRGLTLLVVCLSTACSTTPKEVAPQSAALSPAPKELADSLKKLVTDLSMSSAPNRSVNSPGHKKAFEFLKAQLEIIASQSNGRVLIHEFKPDVKFAIQNYEKDFATLVGSKFPKTAPEYKKWRAFTDGAIKFVKQYRQIKGRNLILELPGTSAPGEVLYVGAHYDTITHDHTTMEFTPKNPTAGADDNGSAVAAILTIAREMSGKSHARTLRFVFFDYEEIFFLGSYELAKALSQGKLPWTVRGEKNLGLINLEMIGWSSHPLDSKSIAKIYTREPSDKASADVMMANKIKEVAARIRSPLKFEILQNGFNRSDNWSFWQKGIPAICVSEDWENDFNEKNYHTDQDLPESLNYPYLAEITRAVSEAVSEIADLK
jgi:hypothetical protein